MKRVMTIACISDGLHALMEFDGEDVFAGFEIVQREGEAVPGPLIGAGGCR